METFDFEAREQECARAEKLAAYGAVYDRFRNADYSVDLALGSVAATSAVTGLVLDKAEGINDVTELIAGTASTCYKSLAVVSVLTIATRMIQLIRFEN
jgi:hypothetical protein